MAKEIKTDFETFVEIFNNAGVTSHANNDNTELYCEINDGVILYFTTDGKLISYRFTFNLKNNKESQNV